MNNGSKKQEEEWLDENMSHGAFALTQEEIEFYLDPKRLEIPIW